MNIHEMQVVKGENGYVVYAAFGAVMRADLNKVVTYSNMLEGSMPYVKMLKALKGAK